MTPPAPGGAATAVRARGAALRLLRYHRSGLLALAVVVGLVSGGGAVLFRIGIDSWTRLLTGAEDYTEAMGPSQGLLSFAGRWFVLLAPVISGALVGPLMAVLGRTTTGHGVGGVIWSARRGDGTVAPVPALASTGAAILTIGGGGAVGPEGPIAELGASAGSVVGRALGLPVRSARMLTAAGTAAGIASAFNAPLAGAFFAMEVILVDFTVDAFAFVVLASVSSSVLSHHLLGTTLSLSLPSLSLDGDAQLGWVALLGALGGLVGIAFSRCRFLAADGCRDLLDAMRLPQWARPAVGGLALGALLLTIPEMYGESSAVLGRALDNEYTTTALLALTAAKIAATSLTMGVGFVGGVFAPSLLIGGTLGAWLGSLVAPTPTGVAVFGVVGMGAVFTGSARAPLTAVILIIEMTGQYGLLSPLMLAVAIATVTSRFLTRTTIYTEELRRRGEDIDDPVDATIVGRATARDLMHEPPAVLTASTSLARAARVVRASGSTSLPVVADAGAPDDAEGPGAAGGGAGGGDGGPGPAAAHRRLLGCVSAVALAQAALEERRGQAPRTVGELPLDQEVIDVSSGTTAVLKALVDSRASGLPVVEAGAPGAGPGLRRTGAARDDRGDRVLLGWVDQDEMVRRLYRHQHAALEASRLRTSLGSRVQARWRDRHR